MKKHLLSVVSACLMATATVTAADTFTYGYCGNEMVNDFGGVGSLVAAIEIPADVASSMVGCKLVGMEIGWGSGTAKKPTIFISENKIDFNSYIAVGYKPRQLNGGDKSWNTVTFNDPYEINGTPFYVGYYYPSVGSSNRPVVSDGANPATPQGCYYGWGDTAQEAFASCKRVSDYGNVSIRLIIEGSIDLNNRATVRSVSAPMLVSPGETFTVTVSATNDGTNDITSVAGVVNVDGTEFEFSKTFDTPVTANESIEVTLDNAVCENEGQNLDITAEITTVNGESNNAPYKQMSTSFICSSSSFVRNVVVEEFTGTWCTNCINGFAGMEYMNRTYPDSFIGIAMHGPTAANDSMFESDFSSLVYQISSYPNAWANRQSSFYPNEARLREVYAEFYKPCFERVLLEAVYTDNNRNKLNIRATTEFATPLTDIDYALTFVITRDHVGPGFQASTGAVTVIDANGEPSNASPVLVYFDDVATQTPNVYGIEASRMTDAEKGERIEFSYTMPLKFVNSDPDNINLIALLLDRKTDTIINATKMRGRDIVVGVLGNSIDNVRVEEEGEAEFYNMQGIRVLNPSNGIFIRRIGDQVAKVRL